MNQDTWWLVKLEFERVQTYLFAVPQLKAMIGANTRMGELLRGALDQEDFVQVHGKDNLPWLARRCGASLPPDVDVAALGLPEADPQDPLLGTDRDNPRLAFAKGILSRDGGHLHATFARKDQAEQFIEDARRLVGCELPGLLLDARVIQLQRTPSGWRAGEEREDQETRGRDLADLPQFQVCMRTGQGPAAERDERESAEGGNVWVSASVLARREAADRFDRGGSTDVLGLLRSPLLDRLGLPRNASPFPTEFTDVAPSGYLAVFHADGNRIGNRSLEYREGERSRDFFAREARGERFFQCMRRVVRQAVLDALTATFAAPSALIQRGDLRRLPFRLMMLGGDDLLLVCDAAYALELAVHYAKALQNPDRTLADGRPLHVGIGIAVVKHKFPFHRAHALAEQLAASAKKLSRRQENVGSVLDWLSVAEAWHDDLADVRRQDAMHTYQVGEQTETLLFTRRPYAILGEPWSVEKLCQGARTARERGLARTQLMALADMLPRGRRQSEWELGLLGPELRDALAPGLVSGRVWGGLPDNTHVTGLLDFLEVYELDRLHPENRR